MKGMNYTQLGQEQVDSMLRAIGAESIEELLAAIPSEHRLDRPLRVPDGLSEMELLSELEKLAARNASCKELACFMGSGAYDHFIPTIVDHLASKAEFLTAYTPYQAEASQGPLQAFYEFQTMVCQLTGMDVSNASLYEQASAVAEAVLMARATTRRAQALLSRAVHPDTVSVMSAYSQGQATEPVQIPFADGVTDVAALANALDDQTAAVVIQSPNFFGCVEPVHEIARVTHEAGAVLIVCVDPIICGVLKRPGELGADIVVAEGQPLGIPLNYGGPYLGLLACRQKFLRRMPGRVVGRGSDAEGRESFCLTLQTREQHIRRQHATSNVCTNEGLMAMRAAVYLAAMGRNGLATVASQCLDKAHYAARRIAELDGYQLRFDKPFFKEFTVRTSHPVPQVQNHCRARGILAGASMGCWFEELNDCFTVAVTEKRTAKQIDELVEALKTV
jgi:glycine dehydrogenase subunit 1